MNEKYALLRIVVVVVSHWLGGRKGIRGASVHVLSCKRITIPILHHLLLGLASEAKWLKVNLIIQPAIFPFKSCTTTKNRKYFYLHNSLFFLFHTIFSFFFFETKFYLISGAINHFSILFWYFFFILYIFKF